MGASAGLNIAVFASGNGSNLTAIAAAIDAGAIPGGRIVLVVSNNSGSGALAFARTRGIPALHCSRMQFPTEADFSSTLIRRLREHRANFIALAGYMKRITAPVIAEFPGRITNIHPALLPAFGGEGMYGMRVHEAVIASGANESGATVHLVDAEYDRGAIILQRRVPVNAGDTPATLAQRVLAVEHQLYPEALRLFAEERVAIVNNRVVIS